MRLNKFIAGASGKSRREADDLIAAGRVMIDGTVANLGARVPDGSIVALDGKPLSLPAARTLIALHKPVGYVSSRRAQAKNATTLYELLPEKYRTLKTVGRLDSDSSGLILLTDDGDLAFQMTHPKFSKTKVYQVRIDKPLEPLHQQMIADFGINLPDGRSKLILEKIDDDRRHWRVIMHEGRNRQIRRTFSAVGYDVCELHRTNFGNFAIGNLKPGEYRVIECPK